MAIDRETLRQKGFQKGIELTFQLMSSLSEEQNAIIIELKKIAKECNPLLKNLRICRTVRPNAAGLIGLPDGGLVVCRNDADLQTAIKSLEERFEEPYKKMMFILNNALNCGLGDLEIIQRYCRIFKVKP
jgi:hypothetical protein